MRATTEEVKKMESVLAKDEDIRRIVEVAQRDAGGRIVSVLEGGYHPSAPARMCGR